jgi:hypothetical protein
MNSDWTRSNAPCCASTAPAALWPDCAAASGAPCSPGGRKARPARPVPTRWDNGPARLLYLDHGDVEIDNNSVYAARGISQIMPPPDLCRVAA